MTNITRVIKDLIEENTYAEITANVGNTEPVTIDSIVYADQTWANTSNTSVPVTGGYIKLYGKSFEPNANILFGSTTSTSNVVSNNEIQVSVPALATGTYTLFLYNPSGSNAIKYKSIPVQGDFNYGWFAGGQSGTTIISSVERIDFNNDTVNTDIRAALPKNTVFASSAETKDNGYIFGGANTSSYTGVSAGFFNSSVYRITYANDETSALIRASISPGTQRWRATAGNKNYAYTSGGFLGTSISFPGATAPAVSSTDRLDFSNDSGSLTSKGPLSIPRMKFSSISNDSYGWYLGGSAFVYWITPSSAPTPATTGSQTQTTTFYSIVDRLNFSSDTTTSIVRGPLVGNKSFAATTKNADYGWISAGVSGHSFNWGPAPSTTNEHIFTHTSDVQRMTFANDNLQMVVRSPSMTSIASAAGGNENYGWFTAGYSAIAGVVQPGPNWPFALPSLDGYSPTLSNITRLTYASDTTTLSNRSSFFQSRKYHTGNSGVVS